MIVLLVKLLSMVYDCVVGEVTEYGVWFVLLVNLLSMLCDCVVGEVTEYGV